MHVQYHSVSMMVCGGSPHECCSLINMSLFPIYRPQGVWEVGSQLSCSFLACCRWLLSHCCSFIRILEWEELWAAVMPLWAQKTWALVWKSSFISSVGEVVPYFAVGPRFSSHTAACSVLIPVKFTVKSADLTFFLRQPLLLMIQPPAQIDMTLKDKIRLWKSFNKP